MRLPVPRKGDAYASWGQHPYPGEASDLLTLRKRSGLDWLTAADVWPMIGDMHPAYGMSEAVAHVLTMPLHYRCALLANVGRYGERCYAPAKGLEWEGLLAVYRELVLSNRALQALAPAGKAVPIRWAARLRALAIDAAKRAE